MASLCILGLELVTDIEDKFIAQDMVDDPTRIFLYQQRNEYLR